MTDLRRCILASEEASAQRDVPARRRLNELTGGTAGGASTFRMLARKDDERAFRKQLKLLLGCPRDGNLSMIKSPTYCGEIDDNCARVDKKTKKETVNIGKAYFRDNMQRRAEYLLWYESHHEEAVQGRASRRGSPAAITVPTRAWTGSSRPTSRAPAPTRPSTST